MSIDTIDEPQRAVEKTKPRLDLKLLVISLPGAHVRQRLMHAQLDLPGMPPYVILDGIDARKFGPDELAASYDDVTARQHLGRPVTLPEIGCLLSHLKACRYIVEHNIPVAIIFEDDALIGHQFLKVLDQLIPTMALNEPEIVLLTHVGRYSAWSPRKVDKIHYLYKPYAAYGAHAYVITIGAARALAKELFPIYTFADDWGNIQKLKLAKVSALVPYCVGTSILANSSQIGNERFNLDFRSKTKRLLRKYVYKKFLFQIFVKPTLRLRKCDSTW